MWENARKKHTQSLLKEFWTELTTGTRLETIIFKLKKD